MIQNDSSLIRRKRSGELWSTNYKVGLVSLDARKLTFGDYIMAIRGSGVPLNFYTR